ncbi:hypothetical protein Bca4012_088415 [Brassica carinata]|uniref:Transmembrane protein n=1 Tax=Brassica oleracea TaxID=3712 RepID=A0A3P6G059_BRAOL|nr:unnamed protein product [Brassica oleracea]
MSEIKARRILLLSIIFLFFFSETLLLCSANEHGSRNLAVVMRKRIRNRGPRNSTSAASPMMLPSSFHIGAASSFLLALLL